MAAPTQQYPSWLTTVVSETTDEAGNVGLETSVMYLPLTYYGPSIPLGTDWTYGGLTSPASTSTEPTTETTAIPTTTENTSTLPTTTAIPTSSIPTSISPTSSLPTTSTQPTSPLPPTATSSPSSISRGQLIGIIVGTVLGSVFLFITLLTFFLCWYRKRRRRQETLYSFRERTPPSPTESDYHFVSRSEASLHDAARRNGDRAPGEGSPRHSGEEADPFLQPSSRHGSHDNTQSSKGSSSTGSGYGTVLPKPSAPGPETGPYAYMLASGDRHILSKDELRRLDEVDEEEEPYNPYSPQHQSHPTPPSAYHDPFSRQPYPEPLMPPPRLVDPSRSSSRLSQHSGTSAVVMTAQREKLRAEAPQVISSSPSQASSATVTGKRNSATGSGLLGSLGLAGLGARIMGSASSRGSSRRNSYAPIDSEADRFTDMPPRMRERLTVNQGERPISSVSAKSGKSGETIYHSLPGTPLMPPARTLGHSSSNLSREFGVLPRSSGGVGDTPSTDRTQPPTAYEDTTLSSTATAPTSSGDVDILDLPAPRTVPSFTSLSASVPSTMDDKDKKKFPYPPGLLSMPAPEAWQETQGTTPSPGSFAASGYSHQALDDAPPRAPPDWAAIRRASELAVTDSLEDRRGTFGLSPALYQPSQPAHSEAASLHSHLSPSTGSGSSGHKQDHSGSSSSRRTGLSHTLSHSGSISEDSQQSRSYRIRGPGSLSPFGARSQSPRLSAVVEPPREEPYAPLSARSRTPPLSLFPGIGLAPTPPPAAFTNRRASPNAADIQSVPWAGGLGENWNPT
ncbi:hypothetical protein VNI00_010780 [Paramarasmius palmivorus]|uniref:Uncharacterized protein n=1 Tax=Paramarasmius palmivorus TaxID=297713 RepID=A0AAW0CFE2_9AGAR